jgi:hypothetical protein
MDLKFDVNIDRTGERQTINGYDCEKVVLTMKSRWWEKPKARSKENVTLTYTQWCVPQMAEDESTMTIKDVITLALDPILFVPPASYKRDQ